MLKYPDTDVPYNPDIYSFLYGFDIYGKDEEFIAKLEGYNPNNINDRQELIECCFIERYNTLSYRHKYVFIKLLSDATKNKRYDFSKIINSYEDDYSCLPWSWNIENPREFFEDILRIAKDAWKDDLYKASLEDQSTW